MLSLSSVIQRQENYVETELDDEIIVMHVCSGNLIGFADSAKAIWAQISKPILFGEIIDRLLEQFDIERDACVAEVGPFLTALEEEGLIKITHS